MPAGPGIVAAVASGDIDLGFANLFAFAQSFAQSFARGSPIRVLAAGQLFRVEDSKSFALVVLADSPYRIAKDLNGKKIGVNAPVSIVGVGAEAWIDRNGGDSSTVQLVQVPFGSVGQALEAGRADAVSTTFSAIRPRRSDRRSSGRDGTCARPGSTPIAIWRGGMRAHSWRPRDGRTHQNNTGQILMKYLHLTPAGVRSLSGHRVIYSEKLDPTLMEPLISVAAQYGIIPKPFPARDMVADLA